MDCEAAAASPPPPPASALVAADEGEMPPARGGAGKCREEGDAVVVADLEAEVYGSRDDALRAMAALPQVNPASARQESSKHTPRLHAQLRVRAQRACECAGWVSLAGPGCRPAATCSMRSRPPSSASPPSWSCTRPAAPVPASTSTSTAPPASPTSPTPRTYLAALPIPDLSL